MFIEVTEVGVRYEGLAVKGPVLVRVGDILRVASHPRTTKSGEINVVCLECSGDRALFVNETYDQVKTMIKEVLRA